MDLMYKNLDIKEITTDKKEFTAIISTNDVDSYDEVLLPEGLNAKKFATNPIILFNHNRDMPIGKSLSIRKSGNGLVAKGKLAEGILEIDNIWKLIKQGILKGVSVGFRVIEERKPTPEDIKLFGKKVRNVISKWSLMEFSVVSLPANQSALITSCKELKIDPKSILGESYIDTKEDINIIEEEIEKIEKEVEVSKEIKEKLVEVVKDSPKKVDMKDVLKYFTDEVKKQIKINKGQLF